MPPDDSLSDSLISSLAELFSVFPSNKLAVDPTTEAAIDDIAATAWGASEKTSCETRIPVLAERLCELSIPLKALAVLCNSFSNNSRPSVCRWCDRDNPISVLINSNPATRITARSFLPSKARRRLEASSGTAALRNVVTDSERDWSCSCATISTSLSTATPETLRSPPLMRSRLRKGPWKLKCDAEETDDAELVLDEDLVDNKCGGVCIGLSMPY
mmetsp:Transcript_39039/g.62996  ORF Transcript_39039/g.62996 Transcript_39039/m.62996 type:complete len:216 (-) Transcript_39039:6906-7553(-)